jgi:hypothetical protein
MAQVSNIKSGKMSNSGGMRMVIDGEMAESVNE